MMIPYKKSPLRYPGGKSRAVKYLLPYFPTDLKTVCSPFFGGGSIELALADHGIKVYGYDLFKPLVYFWKALINDPQTLVSMVACMQKSMNKENFKRVQKLLAAEDYLDYKMAAAYFYSLNRSSFSGTVLSGGYSTPNHPRFTVKSVENLSNFNIKNFTVKLAAFSESIQNHSNTFLYCDPPYLIESNLYGNKGDLHKDFDHLGLAVLLKKRKQWILSYNNCEKVLDLYRDYDIVEPKWSYGMSQNKKSKELLILNI